VALLAMNQLIAGQGGGDPTEIRIELGAGWLRRSPVAWRLGIGDHLGHRLATDAKITNGFALAVLIHQDVPANLCVKFHGVHSLP